MNSSLLTRTTGRNVAAGVLAGVVAGFVPLVTLVAPLLAGGVAGYLERAGPRRGVVVGALTGLVLAVVGSVLSLGFAVMNLGVGPVGLGSVGSVPALGLLVAGALWTLAAVGQAVVAAVGGGLGAIVEEDRDAIARRVGAETGSRARVAAILVSAALGLVAFAAVGLAVTALLDPYIWPSMLVGLPVGAIAGAAIAVLSHRVLVRRTGSRGGGGTPGAT